MLTVFVKHVSMLISTKHNAMLRGVLVLHVFGHKAEFLDN